MTEDDFKKILSFVEKQDFIHAMQQLHKALQETNDWTLQNEAQQITDNYHLLLKYYEEGTADDQRLTLYHSFLAQCWFLANKTYRKLCEKDSTEEFFMQLRTSKERAITIKSALDNLRGSLQDSLFSSITDSDAEYQKRLRKNELLLDDMFYSVWTSEDWNTSDFQTVQSFLDFPDIPIEWKQLLLSAVSLGAYHFFDPQKALLLCSFASHEDSLLNTRALIGLLFVLMKYHKMLFCCPQIGTTIRQMVKNEHIAADILHIQLSLLAQNSQELEKKINEDILPFIRKENNEFPDISQINDILNEDDVTDQLPDKEIQDIHDKLKDLMELQASGADMSYFSFSHLKNFPFFHAAPHWFLPFSLNNTYINREAIRENPFVTFLIHNNSLCDSDKYSLCLMLSHLPNSKWSEMTENIKTQLGDDFPDALPHDSSPNRKEIQRHYLQDCYRYFMLFPNQQKKQHPFQNDLLLFHYPLLAPFFKDKDTLLKIAYFCYKQKKWSQAADTYDFINQKYTLSQESLQIYGYILQKTDNHSAALLCYEKASLIQPDETWTMKRLGLCYLKTGQYAKALNAYSRLIHLLPDDNKVLQHYGECLILLGKYEKALEIFYKLEYLYPHKPSTLKALGWCAIQTGNASQACKYLSLLANQKPTVEHLLLAGHAFWANKDLKQALSLYRQAARKQTGDFLFDAESRELLLAYGILDLDIHLMQDLINSQEE